MRRDSIQRPKVAGRLSHENAGRTRIVSRSLPDARRRALNEARYFLDTSAVSKFAPSRQPTGVELANWFERNSERFFISVVTIAETEQGVRKLTRSGGTERAKAHGLWLDGLVSQFGDRLT